VQHFINHAAIERAAAEIFSSARARHYLYGLTALAVATVAGVALAAIWMGLALLVDATRATLKKQLSALSATQAAAAALALDVATSASLAVAPAIAWYSGTSMGGAIAAALIIALMGDTAFNAKRGRVHALITCAPYALLGIVFLIESANLAAFTAIAMAGAVVAYVFTGALHQVHRAAHARMQDAEWVRQLNMSFGETASAGWEIDFERGRVAGAQRLGALIGRPVSYSDIVERDFFAPTEDRALVHSAFAPAPGAVRRIALEHEIVRADGTKVRVRHQGFVRTTPDGQPVRVTCVTRLAEAATTGVIAPATLADAKAALSPAKPRPCARSTTNSRPSQPRTSPPLPTRLRKSCARSPNAATRSSAASMISPTRATRPTPPISRNRNSSPI
jgi:PAS domain-containing protein